MKNNEDFFTAIEVLSHPEDPEGFLIVFPECTEKKRMIKIQEEVLVGLIELRYIPRQTEIKEKCNLFYFSVETRYPKPGLKKDLIRILCQALERREKSEKGDKLS